MLDQVNKQVEQNTLKTQFRDICRELAHVSKDLSLPLTLFNPETIVEIQNLEGYPVLIMESGRYLYVVFDDAVSYGGVLTPAQLITVDLAPRELVDKYEDLHERYTESRLDTSTVAQLQLMVHAVGKEKIKQILDGIEDTV